MYRREEGDSIWRLITNRTTEDSKQQPIREWMGNKPTSAYGQKKLKSLNRPRFLLRCKRYRIILKFIILLITLFSFFSAHFSLLRLHFPPFSYWLLLASHCCPIVLFFQFESLISPMYMIKFLLPLALTKVSCMLIKMACL